MPVETSRKNARPGASRSRPRVFYAPSPACAHTVLRTILCTVRIPSARHAVFRLAAPSFSIFPSHARTVKHHLRRSVFSHPAILFPHHPFPSPMLHSSPSSRSVRPPSFSFPVFPPVFALQKRNSKKLQKNAKKVLTNRTWGGIISKLSAREQLLQQRRPPLPHSGRTLKIKQCMTERNT